MGCQVSHISNFQQEYQTPNLYRVLQLIQPRASLKDMLFFISIILWKDVFYYHGVCTTKKLETLIMV